jgi:hypothetical protein
MHLGFDQSRNPGVSSDYIAGPVDFAKKKECQQHRTLDKDLGRSNLVNPQAQP